MSAHEAFETALAELASLRRLLAKNRDVQVRGVEERSIIKATGYAYFNSHRASIAPVLSDARRDALDGDYNILLDWCERTVSRSKYRTQIDVLKGYLVEGRGQSLMAPPSAAPQTTDVVPNFGLLVADARMQGILANRWAECVKCLGAGAPLSATVMMGGLLEAVLLARVHRETNKAPIFTAAGAPRDHLGKSRPLNEWTLQHYISVAHELDWITVTAMSVGEVLRDYRNYVHPHKEYSHGVALKPDDASLWWEISKTIVRQVIKSAP